MNIFNITQYSNCSNFIHSSSMKNDNKNLELNDINNAKSIPSLTYYNSISNYYYHH